MSCQQIKPTNVKRQIRNALKRVITHQIVTTFAMQMKHAVFWAQVSPPVTQFDQKESQRRCITCNSPREREREREIDAKF